MSTMIVVVVVNVSVIVYLISSYYTSVLSNDDVNINVDNVKKEKSIFPSLNVLRDATLSVNAN